MVIEGMLALAAVVAAELSLARTAVERTLALFADRATVPFIARYRKEATGGLDEVPIGQIQERHEYHLQLEARRTTILDSIAAQGKLSDDLRARILAARSKTALEDLYLAYKPKRRTKATISRDRDLEPASETFRIPAFSGEEAALAADLEAALVDSWRRLLAPSIEALRRQQQRDEGPSTSRATSSRRWSLAFRHRVEAIAVGNGTAGRETHELVRAMTREQQPLAEVASITGWRIRSELLTRQWMHVDLGSPGGSAWSQPRRSTEKGRNVPLAADAPRRARRFATQDTSSRPWPRAAA